MYFLVISVLLFTFLLSFYFIYKANISDNIWLETKLHGYLKGYTIWSVKKAVYVIGIISFFLIVFMVINYRELTGG